MVEEKATITYDGRFCPDSPQNSSRASVSFALPELPKRDGVKRPFHAQHKLWIPP